MLTRVDVTEANWELLMDINLKGMFLTIKHVLPVMRDQGSGVIINISSTASLCTRPTMLAYKTSKAAINAMTQNLAIENAEYGVRVNAILPGLMDTPMAIERRVMERGCEPRGYPSGTGPRCAISSKDGLRLGCRCCRCVPRLRRCTIHHRGTVTR